MGGGRKNGMSVESFTGRKICIGSMTVSICLVPLLMISSREPGSVSGFCSHLTEAARICASQSSRECEALHEADERSSVSVLLSFYKILENIVFYGVELYS